MTADFPTDDTGDVLRNLKAHGLDFSKEHDVEFFLSFDDMKRAEECAQAIRRLGSYQTEIDQNEQTGTVDVIASRSMLLEHLKITETERLLGEVARRYGGWSDGWGTLQD